MKILVLSDLHGHHKLLYDLPQVDLVIIAGDFTNNGSLVEISELGHWVLKQLRPRLGWILVPGNHDFLCERSPRLARDTLVKTRMLIDESCILDGVRFYGSPYVPFCGNWAFSISNPHLMSTLRERIHPCTQVLITHSPPYGILDSLLVDTDVATVSDFGVNPYRLGCISLRERIPQLEKLEVHVFGHIHESYGAIELNGVIYVNAALWDHKKNILRPPWLLSKIHGIWTARQLGNPIKVK